MNKRPHTAGAVQQELETFIRPDKAAFLPGFFQAVPGGYGEGDQFLGCVVPDQRKVARQFRDLPRNELGKLFASKWHECRLTGMLILVNQFERSLRNSKKGDQTESPAEIVDYYLSNFAAVNKRMRFGRLGSRMFAAMESNRPSRCSASRSRMTPALVVIR